MSGSNSPARSVPRVPEQTPPPELSEPPEADLPPSALPLVAAAFAAGLLFGTRSGRHLTRGVLRAGLLLVKPALVVGGLVKLSELSKHPTPPSNQP